MRILAITNLFPNAREPNRGVFNLQQFEALRRYGELRVVAPIAWKPWADGPARRVPYAEEWSGIPTLHPLYVYTPGIGRALYGAWMYASLRRTVLRLARAYQPNVILATWAYPDVVAAALLARRIGLPWVARVHGNDVNVLTENPGVARQVRWALRQASSVLAVSRAMKERLGSLGVPEAQVRVLHNGVHVDRFYPRDRVGARKALGLPLERRICLYVGHLLVSKGALDLFEAFCQLVGERHCSFLCFVGGGEAQARIAEKVRREGLADQVLLVGPRPHAEIPCWIAAADVLCLPSHREGCPNVVLEALACGRPVVASHVGAIPELIDSGCGALVPPGDPVRLADALRAVLSRDWDPSALRERVLPLSWEANARAVADALSRAVRGAEYAVHRAR